MNDDVNFQKWKETANCCGTLAYVLGKVPEFLKLLPGRYPAEESHVPKPAGLFPGYISTSAGLRFIRDKQNCREIKPRDAIPGDIVLFMDSVYWNHGGIYVGKIDGREMMFAKDGDKGDFRFSGIEDCFLNPDVSKQGFFRVVR